MFAIAFDLDYLQTSMAHPRGTREAYREIERVLVRYEFRRVQQSVFVSDSDSLADLTFAMSALRAIPWLPACIKDIRAFRVENWSDFTAFVKAGNT